MLMLANQSSVTFWTTVNDYSAAGTTAFYYLTIDIKNYYTKIQNEWGDRLEKII